MDFCFQGEYFCWHPILPDLSRPLRRALRPDPPVVCPGFGFNRSKKSLAYSKKSLIYSKKPLVSSKNSRLQRRILSWFDIPRMERVYRDNKASMHCLAARKEKTYRPSDKPQINRECNSYRPGLTAYFLTAFDLHGILLVRASRGRSGDVSSISGILR